MITERFYLDIEGKSIYFKVETDSEHWVKHRESIMESLKKLGSIKEE